MFGWKKRKEIKGLETDFAMVMKGYRALDDSGQLVVAIGLSSVWRTLHGQYGNIETFLSISKTEQLDYLVKLSKFEQVLLDDGQRLEALGPVLLKMYLAPLIEGNYALAERFARQIEPINQKGWAISSALGPV